MKNNNLIKLIKAVIAGALLSALLIACGKKNVDPLPVNAFTKNCPGCDGITGFPFFTATTQALSQSGYGGSYNSGMTLSWSFSGQNISGQAQGQTYNPHASPAMNYVGKVSAAGKVTVAGVLNLGFCPAVPAGTYDLSTQTVGQWANGQISGLRMLITGPVTMTVTLSQAQASQYSYSNSYSQSTSRIYGTMIIEQVNGYYCQGAQFYLN